MSIYEDLENCTGELIYEDIELDNINFVEYDINNITFAGVIFKKCDFSGVYLSSSFFGGSTLDECILKNNILHKAHWNCCKINNCNIVDMDAFRTSFWGAEFNKVSIVDGKLIKCELMALNLKDVRFLNCDLSYTTFKKSKFENCIFENCIFEHTRFSEGISGENIIFKNTTVIKGNNKKVYAGNEVLEAIV